MRIKVDFSAFFDDERKLSVVNVNTEEAATVRDVLHKIIRMFKLAPTPQKRKRGNVSDLKLEFGLFEEGFYIPPDETSTVLQDIGILKLKSLSNVNEEITEGDKKRKRKKQKVEEEEEERTECIESPAKNRRSKRHGTQAEENEKEGDTKSKRRSKRHIVEEEEEEEEEEEDEEEEVSRGKRCRHVKESVESVIAKDEEEVTKKKKGRRKKGSIEVGFDTQEEEVYKGKKGRRKRDSGECNVPEELEEEVTVENVVEIEKGRHQSGRKTMPRALPADAVSNSEEISRRTKRKEKHVAESDSEAEEHVSKRKHKSDSLIDTASVEEEVSNASLKDKRKYKRDKMKNVEDKITVNEACGILKTNATARRSLAEVNEASAATKVANPVKQIEKRSQEKEVSTSNVIHVESDEALESSSTCSSSEGSEKMEMHSVDAGILPTSNTCTHGMPKRKRKRKHNKAKKAKRGDDIKERELSAEGRFSNNVTGSSASCEWQRPLPVRTAHRHSYVSTSNPNTHLCFPSDDEEEVTSVTNSGDGNDIEILETASKPITKSHPETNRGAQLFDRRTTIRKFSAEVSSRQHIRHSTPICNRNPAVIDIGDEAAFNVLENTDLFGNRLESQFLDDGLTTLRRISEQNTITVVSVSSKSKTAIPRPAELPSSVSSLLRHGPPCQTFRSTNEIGAEARNTFYNLLALRERSVPLLLRRSKESIMNSPQDDDGITGIVDCPHIQECSDIDKPDSFKTGSYDVPMQMSPCAAEDMSVVDTDSDSGKLHSIPSTSYSRESDITMVDKPGPSNKAIQRETPRPFRAVGAFLSSLRNPKNCSKEEEEEEEEGLQVVSNDDEEIQAIASSPEEIPQDSECMKGDGLVTSTQEELKICLEACPEVISENVINVQNEEKEESGGSDADEPALCINEDDIAFPTTLQNSAEKQDVLQELFMESMKEELLKELQKGSKQEGDESRFYKYPLMKTLPKEGEYIAIRFLDLDESLQPIHSEYKQVQVLKVNGQMIKLKIAHNVKKQPEVKKVTDENGVEEVDLTFEEEVDLTVDEQGDVLELDWRDVVEPRLLFP